jgi:hypothetical protein
MMDGTTGILRRGREVRRGLARSLAGWRGGKERRRSRTNYIKPRGLYLAAEEAGARQKHPKTTLPNIFDNFGLIEWRGIPKFSG